MKILGSILFVIFAIGSANIFASEPTTELPPPFCASLQSLGITQLSYNNFMLPLRVSDDQSQCGVLRPGETCYFTWNLNIRSIPNWTPIILEVAAKTVKEATDKIRNTPGIFQVAPMGLPGDKCSAKVNNVYLFMHWHGN